MDVPLPSLLAAPVLAGLAPTAAVSATLANGCPHIRLEPAQAPPFSEAMLRVETSSGRPLKDALAGYWHRRPYVLPLRLAGYAPGSVLPEVLDHAVIGTRGDREAFYRHAELTALRLVRDAVQGRGRGEPDSTPHAGAPAGLFGGWIDHARARWTERLCSEWWSLGVTPASLSDIVATGGLGPVIWLHPEKGAAYFADPFPWQGTDEILCEEMPIWGGTGRIVALAPEQGTYRRAATILEDRHHHSYPCTFREGDTTWLLPEATERGATVLYQLDADRGLRPVCSIAPQRRLSDSTLFRHDDRYWIACADLDVGPHDSLCLLHATRLEGPWQPHRLHPVRIDIRGARPAGAVFGIDGALFRPGQNCTATYGGGITVHRIDLLTPDDYRETAVASLQPDPTGPFPHGLHTLVSDGTRTWVDGKRFVFDWTSLWHKLRRRITGGGQRQEKAGIPTHPLHAAQEHQQPGVAGAAPSRQADSGSLNPTSHEVDLGQSMATAGTRTEVLA